VFVAKDFKVFPDSISDQNYFREISKIALRRIVTVKSSERPVELIIGRKLILKNFKQVTNGFNIFVSGGSEGIVVINTPYYPFWEAKIDNNNLLVFPVNGIHTAISVTTTSNVGKIELRWRRPLLREQVINFLNR
jgi:uncharacterized membrane protein YfhO